jgi:alcohol dehydrogenase class IV
LLPNVLRWNGAEANRPLADNAFFAGTRIDDPAAAIAGLIADLGLPSSLSDVGIRREQFGEIAEKAMPILSLPSSNGNCRAVETVQDVLEILEMAA